MQVGCSWGNAGSAVLRRKSFAKLNGLSADNRLPFDEVNLESTICESDSALDTRDAGSNYQRRRVDGLFPLSDFLEILGSVDSSGHDVLRLLSRSLRLVHVWPRAVFSDIGHLEEKRIQAGFAHSSSEGQFMKLG